MSNFENESSYSTMADCACDDGDYIPPYEEERPTTGGKQQPMALRPVNDPLFDDTIRTDLLGYLHSTITTAWGNWENAVTFEDTELQDYYMKYIVLCNATVQKVRRF